MIRVSVENYCLSSCLGSPTAKSPSAGRDIATKIENDSTEMYRLNAVISPDVYSFWNTRYCLWICARCSHVLHYGFRRLLLPFTCWQYIWYLFL